MTSEPLVSRLEQWWLRRWKVRSVRRVKEGEGGRCQVRAETLTLSSDLSSLPSLELESESSRALCCVLHLLGVRTSLLQEGALNIILRSPHTPVQASSHKRADGVCCLCIFSGSEASMLRYTSTLAALPAPHTCTTAAAATTHPITPHATPSHITAQSQTQTLHLTVTTRPLNSTRTDAQAGHCE